MKWIELLRRGKSIYNFAELVRLTGLSSSSLRRAIHRLLLREVLFKLGKGLYANSFHSPSLEEVAAILYPPSYISLESGLFTHGIVEQAPHGVTCISTNKTKSFQTALGSVHYAHIKKGLFWGYEFTDEIPLAWPEKAALDFVYIQRQNGLNPSLDEWNWRYLDVNKLFSLAGWYPRVVDTHFRRFVPHPGPDSNRRPTD
ncbi:MAG: hypothetical protein ACE5LH_09385 [Fidelibacterota bacterium]